ncbi:MAG: hypothetical protein ACE5FF_01020 [Saprospiraceae bacterium]
MNKLFTLSAFLFCSFAAKAQIELKTNPIALLFGVVPVSAEFVISDDWASEIDILGTSEGGWIYINGKHYFAPKHRADGLNIGAFGGVFGDGIDTSAGLGFFAGYKAVSKKKIVFEVALGLGRAFSSDIDVLPYAKFHLGYRFASANK